MRSLFVGISLPFFIGPHHPDYPLIKESVYFLESSFWGAWSLNPLRATDFKSVAYANSAKKPKISVFPECQIDYLTIIEMVGVGGFEPPTSAL